MSNDDKKIFELNAVQFSILGFLSLFILFDTIPVIIDAFTYKENYRLHDGMGDGLRAVGYVVVTTIVLLTMKFKYHRPDFIAVLIVDLAFLCCISGVGLYRFIVLAAFSIALDIYMLFSFMIKNNNGDRAV